MPKFTLESGCINNIYTITAIPINNSYAANAVTYSWAGPNGFTSSVNPIQITSLPTGVYSLSVTNPQTCSTSKSIQIDGTFCEIPKGISPNDDGNNDFLDLAGFNIEKLKIFNRYGMVVYELDDYTKEWKGQDYNGNQLPSATYYYHIKFRNNSEKTGWIYLQNK